MYLPVLWSTDSLAWICTGIDLLIRLLIMEVPPDIFANDYTAPKRCKPGYFLFNRNDQFVGRALNLYGEWCEREITTPAMGHAPEAPAQVRQRGAQPLRDCVKTPKRVHM